MIGKKVYYINQISKQIKSNQMSQVKVTAKDGLVIIQNENKPNYGYIRFESSVIETNGSFMNRKTRSALRTGEIEVLEQYVRDNNLREGSIVPGRIIAKESFDPFYENQSPKTAGEGGAICTRDGQPIYRQTFYVTDETSQDELIQHNNDVKANASNRVMINNPAASM